MSALARAPWRLLAGPHLPEEDYASLAGALPPGVVLERFRPDFPAMLRRCVLSISQAGYNTTLDILRARARAIVVPFATGSETEQTMRSTLLAERGIVHLVPEALLDAARLAAGIDAALQAPPFAVPAIALDGATRTASLMQRWAEIRNW
jgi:predicted glycosyltransferase